jgi:bacteriochlorophyllide a dehydrogenase
MDTVAVVLEAPERLSLKPLNLAVSDADDVIIDVEFSAISSGTERLLWAGLMPHFPGMGYPLVPGYETVGRVVSAPERSGLYAGERVFVPGANCYGEVKGLFGGASSRIATSAKRLVTVGEKLGEDATLLALAATAHHAVAGAGATLPELIVGHGVLGRLLARVTAALGGAPSVWESDASRHDGATAYAVLTPTDDPRRDYRTVCDASGDAAILDALMPHLAKQGEVTLAGFYHQPVSFAFPPAFMREARIRIAAEWTRPDMDAVLDLIGSGALSLSGLITHRAAATEASDAYRTAFTDSHCLKMVLDWRQLS